MESVASEAEICRRETKVKYVKNEPCLEAETFVWGCSLQAYVWINDVSFSIAQALYVAVLGQETVKLSLKVDAASSKAHGLQDAWFAHAWMNNDEHTVICC